MPLAPELLALLACPRCGGTLAAAGDFLICAPCRLKYPVREGIPVMLLGEAQELE
jgi:uncharacterized protein YbaR (Trm112 family)